MKEGFFHRRDAERAEKTQRKPFEFSSLRFLSVLCGSAVKRKSKVYGQAT
jgi:hypothetical protein